jgi:tetratricopeptide (TPR) repeat protein
MRGVHNPRTTSSLSLEVVAEALSSGVEFLSDSKFFFRAIVFSLGVIICGCESPADRQASLAEKAMQNNSADTEADVTAAITHLSEAIRLEPSNRKFYETRAARLAWLERYQEAQRDFDFACDTQTATNSFCLFTKGVNEGHLGAYSEALRDFEQAILQEPDNAQYYAGQAMAELLLERPSKALSSIDSAVARGPACIYRYLRGVILSRQNRKEEAIKQFESSSCVAVNDIDKMFKGEREFQRSRIFSEQDLKMLFDQRLPVSVEKDYAN